MTEHGLMGFLGFRVLIGLGSRVLGSGCRWRRTCAGFEKISGLERREKATRSMLKSVIRDEGSLGHGHGRTSGTSHHPRQHILAQFKSIQSNSILHPYSQPG